MVCVEAVYSEIIDGFYGVGFGDSGDVGRATVM